MPIPPGIYDVFDHVVATVDAPRGYPHCRDGLKFWPAEPAPDSQRILVLGNSTAMLPEFPWSIRAAEILTEQGRNISLYVGSGGGHTSAQELARVIRDAPPLQPTLIFAMSGNCDLGFLNSSANNSFYHRHHRPITAKLQETAMIGEINIGVKDKASAAHRWLRNHRMANAAARTFGATYVAALQPIMGAGGDYEPTPEEAEHYATRADVVLHVSRVPYCEAVRSFYTEIGEALAREPERNTHVVDLRDAFAGMTGAYLDHRHWTPAGCDRMAEVIAPIWAKALDAAVANGATTP